MGILVVVLVALVVSPASAAIYTGTLSTTAGTLTGTSDWATLPVTFTYAVDNETRPGLWHYVYSISVPTEPRYPAISEILIETDPVITIGNLVNVTLSAGHINTVGLFQNSGDKALMPQSLYAADFSAGAGIRSLTISFDTTYAPFWGNLFIVRTGQARAWNSGFTATSVDPVDPPSVFHPDFILRPGIPEPSTLLILLAGASVIRARRRWRGA